MSTFTSPPPAAAAGAPLRGPVGLFQPGTKVLVGNHRVVVDRYLSEGGFAHVYVVRVPVAASSSSSSTGASHYAAVLKRVAVPDKDALANMRTEVETMKKLKGHTRIVTYIDSHASQLKGGGYEVFLLMEFCDGGGLIDFMNTRLKNRLTEPEILQIFADTAEGVACMHYLKPPLLHRDLKVENVLISKTKNGQRYKLCDFGSSAPPRPAAKSAAEGRLIEDDVQRHTTLQYRSPEMVDVYRKRPIDEKSDIWALGVLLYKLCYYTTPFEEQGQMAILTAKFRYPGYPKFSDRLKGLIAVMLSEDPNKRPNIYQVIRDVCAMRGKEVPIKDIYANRTHSEARHNERMPSPEPNVKSPPLGVSKAPLEAVKQEIPNVTPMRRGRPTASTETRKDADPFAALDSASFEMRSKAVDELSKRYPPAEKFSLLSDRQSGFDFSKQPITKLSDKVTNALADEVFGSRPGPSSQAAAVPASAPAAAPATGPVRQPKPVELSARPAEARIVPNSQPRMVSTGTMTSPLDSPVISAKPLPIPEQKPIWRVPERTVSASRRLGLSQRRPSSQYIERERFSLPDEAKDTLRPPEHGLAIQRSRSVEDRLANLKQDLTGHNVVKTHSLGEEPHASLREDNEEAIESSVDFLRDLESHDKPHHRLSSGTLKRHKHTTGSGTHSPAHTIGKVGHALRRFEDGLTHAFHKPDEPADAAAGPRQQSRSPHLLAREPSTLTITEELSPEMRRELERHSLMKEEQRVADAASAYRSGLAGPGANGRAPGSRAAQIQDRVKSLLDESGRTSPAKKTATGYGKYTDVGDRTEAGVRPAEAALARPKPPHLSRPSAPPKPAVLRQGSTPQNASRPGLAAGAGAGTAPDPGSADWEAEFSRRYPSVHLDDAEPGTGAEFGLADKRRSRPLELRVKDV